MKTIHLFKPYIAPEAKEAVCQVLDSLFLGQGKINDEFENALRAKLGHSYLNTTTSATVAEQLAFHLLAAPNPSTGWQGLEDGDEVLTTPLSCLASLVGPLHSGTRLKIKWVDIDPETLNLDLDDLERKITPKTKVLYPVLWGGYPIDYDRLKTIQANTKEMMGFKPAVVVDGAHAFGSKYKGKYVGTEGNLTTFSLQAIKSLNASDGGILMCPNQDLYKRSRLLRWFGLDRDDASKLSLRCDGNLSELGYKAHMTDYNACLGLANLKHIDWILNSARSNAKYYDENLSGIKGVKLLKRDVGYESSFWIYSMLVEDRPNFIKAMTEKGIHVNQVHMRMDKHDAFKEFRSHLPSLDSIDNNFISIPVGFWLTEEDREYICDSIRSGW